MNQDASPALQPTEPAERLFSLDVLRGFAVLGMILFAAAWMLPFVLARTLSLVALLLPRRYLLARWAHSLWEGHLPVGTLLVNVLGSFAIGIVYVLLVEKEVLHPDWRGVLMVGFLGAFTTFSTFSLETITLVESGHLWLAVGYVLASALTCVIAAGLAIQLTRMIA
jgi:CrcB protein